MTKEPRATGDSKTTPPEAPAFRYAALLADRIEARWQKYWDENRVFETPGLTGAGPGIVKPKFYCLDMFPYPSGAGLHVGHPEGYTATDIISRFKRMKGFRVLHPMGWDAFGLPAEQYAIQTGVHPAITTRRAIDTFRAQLKRFGFSYDWSREFATIDPEYYRWTQWIWLRAYGAWYDPQQPGGGRARPIAELIQELEGGGARVGAFGDIVYAGPASGLSSAMGTDPIGTRRWHELSAEDQRRFIDNQRLAYLAEVTVNWCPKLGTVLANEEVIDGKSERGGFPVYRRPLRQWMFRITAYAERLLADLALVDWPESTRTQQAEWIGKSEGAEIDFEVDLGTPTLRVGSSLPESSMLNWLESRPPHPLQPVGFVPRDPYPPGIFGPVSDLIRSRRFLPHLTLPEATYFVTWRCTPGGTLSEDERVLALSALKHFDGERCRVYAASVMPDHVHWVVRPFESVELQKLVESVKHFSARQINKGRDEHGALWDPEQFDHIIRDIQFFTDFLVYIVRNPIEAGLVERAHEYPFTFVHKESFGQRPDAERRATQDTIRVFTTRPDTIFGATYMVVAPEHPFVDLVVGTSTLRVETKDAIRAYADQARNKADVERMADARDKTGVFLGVHAINPATGAKIPVWCADYVLMGYGHGAIMAVPAHDERDHEFAKKFRLPIVEVVKPAPGRPPEECFSGVGIAMSSSNDEVSLDGLPTNEAKERIIAWLESTGAGSRKTNYRLRDWLFSRQRYWGEPFPIVYDSAGHHYPVSEAALPVTLPPLEDYTPPESDEPVPLLAKATQWIHTTASEAGVSPDVLAPQTPVRRETNTMPGWAGSCWYYLRYCDPKNNNSFCSADAQEAWMGPGGVDLYIGGAEHAVLHLLYARFWHKILYDLGEVEGPEPFNRLFHQGMITSYAYQRADKSLVPTDQVEETGEGRFIERATGGPVVQVVAKMSKSLKNVVNPDDIIAEYGADTFRLYEMYMGPLEASKPWNTRDISGMYRFLQRAWRVVIDENTGTPRLAASRSDAVERQLHKAILKVEQDIERLAMNTAIAALIEFVNTATKAAEESGAPGLPGAPLTLDQAERFALVMAPFVPHFSEELWSLLGHPTTLAYEPWPEADPALAAPETIEIPVQILGKVRSRVHAAPDAGEDQLRALALADEKIKSLLEGKTIRKIIVVPGRLVNIVAN